MDRVTTICYGQAKEWENRWDAIDFFKEGVMACEWDDRWEAVDFFKEGAMACDGSEKDRYTTILLKLLAGETTCSDS